MHRPKQSNNFAIQRQAGVDGGLDFIAIVTCKPDHVKTNFPQGPGHPRDVIQIECSLNSPANNIAAAAEVFRSEVAVPAFQQRKLPCPGQPQTCCLPNTGKGECFCSFCRPQPEIQSCHHDCPMDLPSEPFQARRAGVGLHMMIDPTEGSCCTPTVACTDNLGPLYHQQAHQKMHDFPESQGKTKTCSLWKIFCLLQLFDMLSGFGGLKCTEASATLGPVSMQHSFATSQMYRENFLRTLPTHCETHQTSCTQIYSIGSFEGGNSARSEVYRPTHRDWYASHHPDSLIVQTLNALNTRLSLPASEGHFAHRTDMANMQTDHSPYCATRVGEASNPGPAQLEVIRLGITNPTSIISKVANYQDLSKTLQLDLITASETAATAKAQLQFARNIRKTYPRMHWSPPVPAHRHRSDGDNSLRGKAAGVAIMTTLPSREAIGTLEQEWIATCRIIHNVVNMGTNKLQLVTLYGVPSSQKDSASFNNDLLQHALHAISQVNLPAIILGDFNVDPFTLPVAPKLLALGFKDLKQLFPKIHGKDMPPTCRDVTHPDNALVSPEIQDLIYQIEVNPEPWFDAHKVVIITLHMPQNPITYLRLTLPHSFMHLPLNEDHLPEAYEYACRRFGDPATIEEWGQTVEVAVDHALRQTQMHQEKIPLERTQGLPKHCRGRCQPRKPKPCQRKNLTRQGRPGDYQPPYEIHTHATCKKVKQVRRLDSICRGLQKTVLTQTHMEVLTSEWKAVLACQAFKGNFIRWAQSKPEIGPLPICLPTYDLAYTIYQLVKHETTIAIRQDQAVWARKIQYRRHIDTTLQGHKNAFAQLKKDMQPPLSCLQSVETRNALIIPENNHQRVFADNCNAFQLDSQVMVDNVPCSIIQKDDHSLLVHSVSDHDWPDAADVHQTQHHCTPEKMLDMLHEYWQPFWTKSEIQPTEDQLSRLLQTVPTLSIPDCPEDLNLWVQAIRTLNPNSARGIDGISAQELRILPSHAIQHLMTIMNGYKEGFPMWMMWTRTMPVPKKEGVITPSQIRPISVMAQLYRLWSKIQCRHVLSHIYKSLPKAITGFVPDKGPYDAIYEMQWYLEQAHMQNIPKSGNSIDLLKCFNTIDRESARTTLTKLGVPKKMLRQFFGSLQKVTRSWILPDAISTPHGTNRGFPEGDPMSVLTMISIATAWTYMITDTTPDAQMAAYADNWGWTLEQPSLHSQVILDTQTFVAAFTMQVDWEKSWIWMTHPAQLPDMKRAIRQQLGERTLTNLLHAMDLGGQLTYHGPPKLGKVHNRFQEATRRLKRLQAMPHDVKTKAQLVTTAVYPQVFYASTILPIARKHSDTLRTQIADAILGHSVSRNSAIAIHCMPFIHDPELMLAFHAVNMAHRFLYRCTAGEAQNFLKLAAKHSGLAHQCKGPAGCLKFYLGRLGWQIDKKGNITVAAFRTYPLLTTSRHKWKRLLLEAWQEDLLPRFPP